MCSIRAVSIVQSAVSIESQMPDEQYPCSIRVQYPEVSTLFVSSIRAVSCSILQYPAVSCPSMCEQYPCITYPQDFSAGEVNAHEQASEASRFTIAVSTNRRWLRPEHSRHGLRRLRCALRLTHSFSKFRFSKFRSVDLQ